MYFDIPIVITNFITWDNGSIEKKFYFSTGIKGEGRGSRDVFSFSFLGVVVQRLRDKIYKCVK